MTFDRMDLEGVFGGADASVFRLDLDLRITWLNESARAASAALMGRSPCIGDSMLDYSPVDTRAAFRVSFARAAAGQNVVVRRRIDYAVDVGLTWEVRYVPLRDDHDRVVAVLFLATNHSVVTEALARLRLLERAMESAPIGVTIARRLEGHRTELVYANPAFATITGYPVAEVLGRDCRFLNADETPERRAQIRAAILHAYPVTLTLRNRRSNGELFWNRLTIVPVPADASSDSYYVGVQVDVSGEVEGFEAARVHERDVVLGEVAAGVAHDVANLVTIVSMAARPDEAAGDVPALASRAIGGLRRLVRVARARSSTPHFDAFAALRDLEPLLVQTLAGRAELVLDVGSARAMVAFLRPSFERILLGLVSNARDSAPLGGDGSVVVSARSADGFVRIRVWDDGREFSREERAQVLAIHDDSSIPLVRLTTARRELRRAGGDLTFAQGDETVSFELLLPQVDVDVDVPRDEVATGGHETLWLVERDRAVARSIARALEQLGYRVTQAPLDGTPTEPIDLVVADLLSGALGWLREPPHGFESVPILVVSGDLVERPAAATGDGVGFLRKPFSVASLDAAVRALIGRVRR